MAKRRKVIPVTLNPQQRERLERLWFYYGNYGPKTTPGNHSFIQHLLENGIDERPLYTKRTPKSEIPTTECVSVVNEILKMNIEPVSQDERTGSSGLRLISSAEERRSRDVDPEMKAILDDINRRYRVMRERIKDMDDTPDAA
jgi:hypothetical protein